jgi:tRNA-uridine 2-sulfurtransferase
MSKQKAIVLLSGGLDSMLAVKVLQAQGIEVEALVFESNFYGSAKAKESAEQLGIKLHVLDIKKEMLKLVKNPPNGYGKNLNPCVDCHAMMFRLAGEYIKNKIPENNENIFLASGEVLGQRPFSQNFAALNKVIKLAGVEILRPLSAKLLPETEIEKSGLVKRHKLLDIEGRSRERQMALAEKFKIKKYPSPAGGCLLTDPEYSERLGKMLEFWPDALENDVEILKNGRVFWLKMNKNNDNSQSMVLAVIGRKFEDNENLKALARKGDFMIELKKENGPLTIVRPLKIQSEINSIKKINIPDKLHLNKLNLDSEKTFAEILNDVSLITGYYATKARGREVEMEIKSV